MKNWQLFNNCFELRRLDNLNADGSVPGELLVDGIAFPTIERGHGFTSVKQGLYNLRMDMKKTGRSIQCFRFDHPGIRALLIHAALNDNPGNLEGCIAPGMIPSATGGIIDSDRAMEEIFQIVGGYTEGKKFLIWVRNNAPGVPGKGTPWVKARRASGKY